MAVAMLLQSPSGTPERYDALIKETYGSLQPDDLPEGMIFHAAGEAATASSVSSTCGRTRTT